MCTLTIFQKINCRCPDLCFLSGIGLLKFARQVLGKDSGAMQCYVINLTGILDHS